MAGLRKPPEFPGHHNARYRPIQVSQGRKKPEAKQSGGEHCSMVYGCIVFYLNTFQKFGIGDLLILLSVPEFATILGFITFLGGGFQYFLFSALPGEMIQFDEHIFQMG